MRNNLNPERSRRPWQRGWLKRGEFEQACAGMCTRAHAGNRVCACSIEARLTYLAVGRCIFTTKASVEPLLLDLFDSVLVAAVKCVDDFKAGPSLRTSCHQRPVRYISCPLQTHKGNVCQP